MKLKITLLLAFCPIMAIAQRNCDLQMTITHPYPNQTFSQSNQFYLAGVIKNAGPDTVVETDELRVQWTLDGVVFTFMHNGVTDSFLKFTNVFLPPNDTFAFQTAPIIGLSDDTYNSCLTVSVAGISKSITDPIHSNNISCANFTISTVNSTDEIRNNTQVKIFPNPASGTLYWETDNGFKPIHIEIFNAIGKNVRSVKKSNVQHLDLSGLPSGLYLLKMISADEKTAVKQFVIE